jgi:hypothetical protein
MQHIEWPYTRLYGSSNSRLTLSHSKVLAEKSRLSFCWRTGVPVEGMSLVTSFSIS